MRLPEGRLGAENCPPLKIVQVFIGQAEKILYELFRLVNQVGGAAEAGFGAFGVALDDVDQFAMDGGGDFCGVGIFENAAGADEDDFVAEVVDERLAEIGEAGGENNVVIGFGAEIFGDDSGGEGFGVLGDVNGFFGVAELDQAAVIAGESFQVIVADADIFGDQIGDLVNFRGFDGAILIGLVDLVGVFGLQSGIGNAFALVAGEGLAIIDGEAGGDVEDLDGGIGMELAIEIGGALGVVDGFVEGEEFFFEKDDIGGEGEGEFWPEGIDDAGPG